MFDDFFDWNHYMTPRLAPKLFKLALVFIGVQVFLGVVIAAATLRDAPFVALLILLASILGGIVGVVLARLMIEAILLVFRMEAHLAAMRKRWEA